MARKALVDVTRLGVVRVMPFVLVEGEWAVNDAETWHTVGEISEVKVSERTKNNIHVTRKRGKWVAYHSDADGVSRNYAEAVNDLLAYLGLERGTLEDATPPLF